MKTDKTHKLLKERRQNALAFSDYSVFDETPNTFSLSDLSKNVSRDNNLEREILTWAVSTLKRSSYGSEFIKEAATSGWSLSIAERGEYDFHLDMIQKQITLDDSGLSLESLAKSDYFKNLLLVSLVRALRDVWHEKRHGSADEIYGPEHILLAERIRAADCDVTAIAVAWELKNNGYGDLWRHLIGSEDSDLPKTFSNAFESSNHEGAKYKAMAEIFRQWFASESRVNDCDHETLEYMDSVIVTNPGMNPFGEDRLQSWSIEAFSCLPEKIAYLQKMGDEILRNPLYAGMCDEINQQHFSQILRDVKVVTVHDVPFRSKSLAEKIFPDGEFTKDSVSS